MLMYVLGYDGSQKCYRCMKLISWKIIISWHLLFDESSFPYHEMNSSHKSSASTSTSPVILDMPSQVPPSTSCSTAMSSSSINSAVYGP